MLDRGIQSIKGIGPARARVLLEEAGIESIEDLLYYAPRRYLDRSTFRSIGDCFVNEVVSVAGVIKRVVLAGKRKRFLEVVIDDGTDTLAAVFFAGFHYFKKIFRPGEHVLFSGKIEYYRTKQMVHPEFDFIDEESRIQSIHAGRVIPLYPSTEKLKAGGLDSRGFRRIIRSAIDGYLGYIQDPFDPGLRTRLQLLPMDEAVRALHFPESLEDAEKARRRLSFNELFFLQYYLGLSRKNLQEEHQLERRPMDTSLYTQFVGLLPFRLTKDQAASIDEISNDLRRPYPMNRLLQGDVGSGKTVVAMAASLLVLGRGDQVAVMAPTEVLAQQHHVTFKSLAPPEVTIDLLTGSTQPGRKGEIRAGVSRGDTEILIGTHALIQDEVSFKNLGLIIIDEQHRFGVSQRARLREKGDRADLLVMTATPIPRSLSLTLYGDLDSSLIREKPANRKPIKTITIDRSRLKGVYNSMERYIREGRQVYYILPVIEESEKTDLKSATELHTRLSKEVFPGLRIALLHGKLPAIEKEAIMRRFKAGEIDILVSTTVVEVGIDVPNASVMVIEHPERFGLSQLHQLRGRVGRGRHQSFCVLVYPESISEESRGRLETFAGIDDGFRIAEEDLKIRGSGEIIGTRQHGHASGFEFADLASDLNLITAAREEAFKAVAGLDDIRGAFSAMQKDIRYIEILKGIRSKRILSILS